MDAEFTASPLFRTKEMKNELNHIYNFCLKKQIDFRFELISIIERTEIEIRQLYPQYFALLRTRYRFILQKQGEPAIYEDFLNGSKTKSDNEFLIFFHHFEFEKFKPKVLKYSLKNKKFFLNQYTNEKIENYFSYFSNLKNPNLKKQEKFQFLKELHNKIQIDELNEDEIEKTRSMSFEIIKKIFEIMKTPIFNLHAKFREKIIDELNLDGFAKNFYEEEEKKILLLF